MTVDLSAFYFDIRKDALYCDPYSSLTRKACLTVLDQLFRCTVTWLAPMLCFTAEEAWLARDPAATSVHLESFPGRAGKPGATTRWRRNGASCATCAASSPARSNSSARPSASAPRSRRRRSSMSPIPICSPPRSMSILPNCASLRRATLVEGEGPASAFRLDDVPAVAVEPRRAEGRKCARSWKISPAVGSIRNIPT